MPSKNYNGQNPLGGKRIQPSAGLGASGAFAQVELQIGRLQPALSLQSGSLQTPNGRIPSQKFVPTGAGAAVPCQLGKMLVDSENSTPTTTQFKISPGFLTGGGGTELIEPDDLTATIGHFVWLQVAWTANGDATNIYPGGAMGAVTIATGATIPSDTIPVAGSLSGLAHIVLGGWVSDNADEPSPVWVRQGCGSIQLYFCPGGFFFGRSNVVS
jgi:hypothetical protein